MVDSSTSATTQPAGDQWIWGCILLLLFLSHSHASGQFPGLWGKVDTVTSGSANEMNPSVAHNAFQTSIPSFIRMVFERQTASQSQIVVKRFMAASHTWDTAEVVISSSPLEEIQKHPDYAEVPYYFSMGSSARGLVVWQRRNDGHWQIYCSTFSDSGDYWSPPFLLRADTASSLDARVRPYNDSLFLITWRQGSAIMAARYSIAGISTPETVAVAIADSMQYDVCSNSGRIGIAWSAKTARETSILFRSISPYSTTVWSLPETLTTSRLAMPNPHLSVGFGAGTLLYEQEVSGRRDIMFGGEYVSPTNPWNVSDDSSATDVNAQGFLLPIITKRAVEATLGASPLSVCVYEKYRGADSMMIFLQHSNGDTIRSSGHNMNACVGSQLWWAQNGANLMVVWESNRSGRPHIYSRTAWLYFDGVEEPARSPTAFQLFQNFPNPFNPTTLISCQLPVASHLRLVVYDLLGRQVAVLADEDLTASPYPYTFEFDATRLAGGVYFYRMQAGGVAETRKMVVLR
jgi:hypothetical protein